MPTFCETCPSSKAAGIALANQKNVAAKLTIDAIVMATAVIMDAFTGCARCGRRHLAQLCVHAKSLFHSVLPK